ncbi:MAG TPA: NAD-dependent epimerase/dehydratase family protein [Candidatus Sulfotelmatobacter sp.]|jgi:nucleoside-diphosphate-sugar epimerase|nr:NAD-dependent epimerase/dehydratase family protein [Candidatus Sulfotelmatobacter sp.]
MAKPVVVVTGVSGNLGSRLLPLLGSFSVIGVDVSPPHTDRELQFESMDLGQESSTRALYELLRDTHAYAVVHLAFVIDPVRTGVLDVERMWQINVAGTARVMEAATEANRTTDDGIKQFIFPSSVSAYGPDFPMPATEESPLTAHTLPYAIHKKQADEVVQQRSPALRGCSAYILRPHIFAGASVENYLMGAFRGTPNGKGARAERMRSEGKRLPCMLPRGQQYIDNKIQFIHVDDMARLVQHILQREPEPQRLTVLNVAGRGEPLTFGRCIEIAQAKLVRVPGKWAMRQVLKFLWKQKISAIPPEAVPYMTGQYIMNTDRLRRFLGPEYDHVMRYSVADAFMDSFKATAINPMTNASL